ncbi:HAD-IIB family hydrolase [Acinetobacter indicus]|uniref:HAD-IIB family hydrolase n=1 Tax=Acinetobacter indicus TaxID=756892 RepID=UPI0025783DD2|nr:HAD-IIB family hydrolase [Acinetobacter indicus]MDM1279698.1 HAD-IIB family hydrolase [Acinetobacter indicus]
MPKFIIFTDLDGTLLNHDNYSYGQNIELIQRLIPDSPVILCSSKTAAEIRHLQQQLGLSGMPFVAENGAYIYFNAQHDYQSPLSSTDIAAQLQQLKADYGLNFQCFSDCDAVQIAALTGLALDDAARALERPYSEVIIWNPDSRAEDEAILSQHLASNLHMLHGGRFSHILSRDCDKSLAVNWLKQFYPTQMVCIGLGDSENDLDMLKACQHAVVVKRPYKAALALEHDSVYFTRQQAPAGWAEGLQYFLQQ